MLGKGVTLEWVTWIREERTIQLCGGNDLGRAKWESKGGQRLREFIMARMMKMKQKELGLLNVGPTVGKRRTSLNSVSLCPAHGSPLPSPSPTPWGSKNLSPQSGPLLSLLGHLSLGSCPSHLSELGCFHSKSLTGKALPLPSPCPGIFLRKIQIAFLEIVLLCKKKKENLGNLVSRILSYS